MTEFDDYGLTNEKNEYQEKYDLPKLTFQLMEILHNNMDGDPFDVLMKISRIQPNDFLSKEAKFDLSISSNTGILLILIGNGELDSVYFANPTVNIEKTKFIVTNLEEIIDSCTKMLSGHDRKFANHVVSNLKALNYHLWKYNRAEIPFKYEKDKAKLDEALKNAQDARISEKAPPNPARIKALKYLAPELWDKLQKIQDKSIQQDVINLITGVNKVDSYKFSFGPRQKQAEERDIPNLTDLVNKLMQT